ncbi:SdrD B-like domain-containing protein [Streptomyces sp. XY533]|uniref:SdrD B-like domain-containing protein n=1 Tax=Streptomyces sp. XY533 TaxID=1519481 RepID=UPI000AB55B25|nr:SdrD B-like domain-containing protein [Streptomyces sp. XY533]
MKALRKALVAVAAGLALTTGVLQQPALGADPSDGTVRIKVIRDSNTNGRYDSATEPPAAGITVELTDVDGNVVTGVTGPDGVATFPPNTVLTGGKYYVRMKMPNGSFLQPTFGASGGLASNASIVDVIDGDAELTMGVRNPADWCEDNPRLSTVCQVAAAKTGGVRTTVTFNFNERGDSNSGNTTTLATRNDTGNTYGVAYHRQQRRIFTGAHAKRHTVYGPGGQGAIYVTPRAGGATTLFATVPSAGTTAHQDSVRLDGPFVGVVGKESLGDIDISENDRQLFAVNLNDRRLYTYDAAQPTAAAPVTSVAIPNPGCRAASDWRPFGLGVRDGVVYVGGTCSAESTQNAADLQAAVWTYNPVTATFGATPLLTKALNFPRGEASVGTPASNRWYPWTTGAATFPTPQQIVAHPEPILSDIAIESNGDMVLGFRDRFADMTGFQMEHPNSAYTGLHSTVSGGDLNRACRKPDGSFEWEGTGNCPNNAPTRPNGGQAANVVEFYPGENWPGVHQEVAQGAIGLSLREGRLAGTALDPTNQAWTGGLGFFDRTTGSRGTNTFEHGFSIQKLNDPLDGGFGKANGLGDLEVLCDEPAVQIGSRVWYDRNKGGAQSVDDDEPGIPGVTVQLLAEDGTLMATVRTGADGAYYFAPEHGVRPNTKYKIRFDKSTADTSVINSRRPPATSGLVWSPVQSAGPGSTDIDSDAAPETTTTGQYATAEVTTGAPGTVDHTIDAGLYINRL